MKKVTGVFDAVSAFFQSIEKSIAGANRCHLAYWKGEGKPEEYKPFGIESPELVAINMAGIDAADTVGNLLAAHDDEGWLVGRDNVTEERYVDCLRKIANLDLTEGEKFIAKNGANLGWRAGQGFREIKIDPLNRIKRSANAQFMTLEPSEEDKDLLQVAEGARIILDHLEESGCFT